MECSSSFEARRSASAASCSARLVASVACAARMLDIDLVAQPQNVWLVDLCLACDYLPVGWAPVPPAKSVIDLIGNTPLLRLNAASEATGCEILGKAEFLNPGGSIKDRAALGIIRAAEKSGALKPGGTIVEGTAGNTGIGLTMVANALGYKTVIVIPETQAQEKKDALRLLGAELVEVPAKPYRDPNNYVKLSGRLAEKLARENPNGAIWANQFDNTANMDADVLTKPLTMANLLYFYPRALPSTFESEAGRAKRVGSTVKAFQAHTDWLNGAMMCSTCAAQTR